LPGATIAFAILFNSTRFIAFPPSRIASSTAPSRPCDELSTHLSCHGPVDRRSSNHWPGIPRMLDHPGRDRQDPRREYTPHRNTPPAPPPPPPPPKLRLPSIPKTPPRLSTRR